MAKLKDFDFQTDMSFKGEAEYLDILKDLFDIPMWWPSEDELTVNVGTVRNAGFKLENPDGKPVPDGKPLNVTVTATWSFIWISGPIVLGWNGAD